MSIDCDSLIHHIIRPTLHHLQCWSEDLEQLLLGTAAAESGLGDTLNPDQPQSLGLFGVSKRTHLSIWDKYLVHHVDLASSVRGLASQRAFLEDPHRELTSNLSYATAIAWLSYARCGKTLPKSGNLDSQAQFWRRHYHHGRGLQDSHYITCYRSLIRPQAPAPCRAA